MMFRPRQTHHVQCPSCHVNQPLARKAHAATNDTVVYSSLVSTLLLFTNAPVPTYWVPFTPDFSNINNIESIPPFWIGGVTSGVKVIAKGTHPALPEGKNLIYHALTASCTLFSVGYLYSLGCRTTQDITGFRIYDEKIIIS